MINETLIIAHRGEPYEAPENSLSSINFAWANNDEAVEIDIHLSLDNEIVVIHDSDTKRTGRIKKKIKNTIYDDLKKIDIGSFKGQQWKNERIPTLAEVLKTIPDKKKLIIEIKSDLKIIFPLVKVLKSFRLKSNQIEFISFNFEIIKELKKTLPEIKVLWVFGFFKSFLIKIHRPFLNNIISKSIKNNINGLDICADAHINEKLIQKIKSAGLMVYTYTVNDIQEAKRLINLGINGITTDRAKWLRDDILYNDK